MGSRVEFVFVLSGLVCFLMMGMLVSSCARKKPEIPPTPQRSWQKAEMPEPVRLEVEVNLNEGGYAIGEKVVMTLVARNTSDEHLSLVFPSSQRFDFVVRQGKQVIWKWSDGKMFAEALTREMLAPGDSLVYEYTWDQTTREGTKPQLGAYTIQAILKTVPESSSSQRRFGIVD